MFDSIKDLGRNFWKCYRVVTGGLAAFCTAYVFYCQCVSESVRNLTGTPAGTTGQFVFLYGCCVALMGLYVAGHFMGATARN